MHTYRDAETPPVHTPLDCSLSSESYPANVCCNYVDNFFVVSASLASSQRLPSLCVLHATRAPLWLCASFHGARRGVSLLPR